MGETGILNFQGKEVSLTFDIGPEEVERINAMIELLDAGMPLTISAGGDPNREAALFVRKVQVGS